MKKALSALSALILTVVALLLFAQIDDDLSEQSTDFISRLEERTESEAYQYVFGLFAKENESPAQVGKLLLEQYQASISDTATQFDGYPAADKLPLPKGDAFCRTWEEGCLTHLFSSEIDATALLSENQTLVSRYNEFLEFNEYTTLLAPTAHEIIIPYPYLVAAQRLTVLQAVSDYQNGNAKKAVSSLLAQCARLRKALALQDTLIGKLVFVMQLSEVLDKPGPTRVGDRTVFCHLFD